MSSNKRPIDLTGDDDVSSTASRPLKAPRVGGDPPSSTPARSQASQLRYEEDGGNELADELDASQRYDASFANYELYGEDLVYTFVNRLKLIQYRRHASEDCGGPLL
jgi:hypothetical protein